jgi:hypothetical protein
LRRIELKPPHDIPDPDDEQNCLGTCPEGNPEAPLLANVHDLLKERLSRTSQRAKPSGAVESAENGLAKAERTLRRSGAEIHKLALHKGFQPNFPTVKLPESLGLVAETLGLPIGNPKVFSFRRCSLGTEVWLHFDQGLRINLSLNEKAYHPNIEEARRWAFDYAVRHGFQPRQVANRRAARGELTKPEKRELVRMISWQSRFRQHYRPSNQADRRACDRLVSRGLAEETVLSTNSFVWHNGDWRAEACFLATPKGREAAEALKTSG